MIFWGSVPTRFLDTANNLKGLIADLERNIGVNEESLTYDEKQTLTEILHTLRVVGENLERQYRDFKQATDTINQRKRYDDAQRLDSPASGKWIGTGWSTKK